jgi:DNA-directed RNA polymerase subunit RPC12/RpoP
MDVVCDECGKKATGSLGDLLVAGWVQKNPEHTPGRRGWLCPSCGVTILGAPTVPRMKSMPPPGKKG